MFVHGLGASLLSHLQSQRYGKEGSGDCKPDIVIDTNNQGAMASPEAMLAQVQQQMAVMQDRMNNLENQLGAATRTNRTLDQQLRDVTDRLTIAESNTTSGGGDIRGGLFDKKLLSPRS